MSNAAIVEMKNYRRRSNFTWKRGSGKLGVCVEQTDEAVTDPVSQPRRGPYFKVAARTKSGRINQGCDRGSSETGKMAILSSYLVKFAE